MMRAALEMHGMLHVQPHAFRAAEVDEVYSVGGGKECPFLTTFLDAAGCNFWRIPFIQRHFAAIGKRLPGQWI